MAFASLAPNLVAGDTNGVRDVFIRDRQTKVTERASVSATGGQANGVEHAARRQRGRPPGGLRVRATNLVAGDTNGAGDVFLRDRSGRDHRARERERPGRGRATRCSLRAATVAGDRYVAFASAATNLVQGDNEPRGGCVPARPGGGIDRAGEREHRPAGTGQRPQHEADRQRRRPLRRRSPPARRTWWPGTPNGRPDVFVRDRQASFHDGA